jgi:cell surface protein SprA
MNKLFFIILFVWGGSSIQAQITQDSIKKDINKTSLKLPDAPSIKELYTYDPKTDLFYLTKKVGNYHLSYPWVLTPKEYYERVIKEGMNKKFKDYNQAISGKGANAEELRKNLLPVYYVNSKFFESIFGGNKVDIQPTGSLSLDLGLRYTKRDNPSLPVKNRTNTSLIFDQKIQMGLKGSIGERLKLDLNYDTQSTFDFNNQIKLQYLPTEDDILQNVELGNVNLQTTNSLIHGAQSLFGLKTEFQFGKTYITTVFAEQKSGMKTIQAQGDEVITDFETPILKYEENKHFFLAQYFREKYDTAVKDYPFINSNARITRIEVWKTNRSTQTENIRNIVAFQDLGENQILGLDNIPPGFILNPASPPDNSVNQLDPSLIPAGTGALNNNIREVFSVTQGFNGINPENGTDYIVMENAIKLDSSQYKLHPQLGYITLKQNLAADEILAVAFEYTINGQIYRVGEFSDNGIIYPQNLVVKLLKSNMVSTEEPTWALMMKNIYNIDAYDIKPDDFRLNILYANPTPFNYIRPINGVNLPPDVNERILLNVFNMDHLNFQMDPQPKGDGFFDFVPGITIDPRDGRIIFTSTEPFGKYLFEKLRLSPTEDYDDVNTWNANQKHYVYKELYQLSKTQAEQYTSKNKFILKGKYKTAGGDGIPIGGFNIPRGSVTVTAGGRTLVEGVDYVVNYQVGRVNIINPAIKQSNVPVQVSVEQNTIFQQTTKVFKGINVEHHFNKNFFIGGTYMSFKEKPLSWKSNYGNEPLNNTLIGFNGAFSTKLPFLTRWVNRLPNIATDAESNFSIKAEAAYLFPGLSKVSDVNGRSTTYVEDFESSQMFIDLRSPYAWKLASVPARFPESALNDDPNAGINRAKLAWYIIDPIFYTNPPDDIDQNEISKEENRQILINEIFDQDIPSGYPTTVNPLNLVFFPTQRGPYNFDTNIDPNTGKLLQPQQRWGGIMRYLQTNDFEQANVEYIEIWMMDPYFNNPTPPPGGKLYIDLGYISEDILPDGRKQYENGLPGDGSDNNVIITNIARVPSTQSLVYAFSNDPDERPNQDVGLDGFPNTREREFYATYLNSLPQNIQTTFEEDPAADDFKSYLEATGGIIERYKNYNGTEGNTPINVANTNTNYTTGNNTYPDVEDIDKDQSMNTIESYFEYEIDIKPNITVNDQFVADIREKTVGLPNGDQITSRWIQYKIPISEFTSTTGSIADFRSIKFMRMYLNGFQEDQLVLRFAALNLVRGDWRKYMLSLDPADPNPNDDPTQVETSSVSIENNYAREPIPYVLPPGIEREEIYQQNANIRQNEQALSLKICELEPGDARGVYKYNSIDMRQYKRLEMFIHAEAIQGKPLLQDNEAVGFVRFGSDLTDNFYEVQIPLKVTPFGTSNPEEIWPVENRIDLKLELLTKIKLELIRSGNIGQSNQPIYYPEAALDPTAAGKPNPLIIGIKGNPNFGDVKVIMVGVKNRSDNPVCGEFWFNEMRLSEMKNQGGWAGNASIDTNLADFASFSFAGGISTEGFGGLEQGPLERNLEDSKRYNFNSSVNVGQLLPKKWNLKIPVNYTVSEEFIRPKYDPIWRDVPLQDRLEIASTREKDSILEVAQTYTRHRGITLAGVRKQYPSTSQKTPSNSSQKEKKNPKKHIYDIENFTFDFAFNELYHSDYEIKSNSDQQAKLGVNYSYNFKEHSFKPFKKSKKLKAKHLKFLSDFNFNLLPSSITINTNINRRFNNLNFRQIEDYGLDIPPLQNRDYRFDWGYTINYNPTKSINTSFGITHNRSVKNYLLPDGTTDFNNSLWSNFFDIGDPLIHNQNINLSYKLPLDKIPFLNFIQSTYVYNGAFQWHRRSEALADVNGYDLGNTIQNSNSHQINANVDFRKLYKTIGLTELKNTYLGKGKKKRNKKKKKKKTKEKPQVAGIDKKNNTPTLKKKESQDYSKPGKTQKLIGHILEWVTGFQNFKLNYRQNNGIMLPGYLQSVGFAGTFNPSFPFTMGWDDEDVRYEAAKKGWLTQYPDFNEPYLNTYTEEISYQAMYKPTRFFTLTLKGQKSYMENISEQFNAVGYEYHPLLPSLSGNHSISTILLKTSFENVSLDNSPAYERMLDNRLVIARRLAQKRGIPIPPSGYPTGYGPLQTEVILYSFLSGYAGQDAEKINLSPFKNIPIPNWRLKISGLNKIGFIKKMFKNLSLEHSYRSDYTINQFSNNLQTFTDPNAVDASGNYYFKYVMDNVTLTEAFNPLIKINMEMNNSLKMDLALKKDRAISLNLNNYTLSEVSGNEYVVGLGYRFKDVRLPIRMNGRRITFTNDVILKINASIRDNITIIRSLSENNNQITSGQTMYNLKLSADYALTKNLSALFFYNHSFSKFAISTNYPFTNIRGGFTVKYNFGN